MKKTLPVAVLVALVATSALIGCASTGTHSHEPDRKARVSGERYGVHPGDVLRISVWKEENLDRKVVVRPDGGISFPLAGGIQVKGMTVEEIRKAVTRRVSDYISEPEVTVALQKVSGHRFYVVGQVQNPGSFTTGSYIDVMQALSLAGGMTPFAAGDEIKVLRRLDGETRAIPFNYSAVVAGERLEQNIRLRGGDVVVVP